MPTFCRHGRLHDNCPICSRKPRVRPGTVTGQAQARLAKDRLTAKPKPKPSGGSRATPAAKRRSPRAGDLTVRRVSRSVEDGYDSPLVPGIRASDDARRLAQELAFAAARLRQLREAPPGLLAQAQAAPDREEGLWTLFLVAYLSPLEGVQDPFAAIAAARTDWASGELPDLEGVPLGPRAAHDPRRGTDTLMTYRARAQKAGGQEVLLSAEDSLTPGRRFDRAFERLALPRFVRAPRFELLTLAGALGLLDVRPSSLLLSSAEAMDPSLLAAKRIFGIGDAINLQRRASELLLAVGGTSGALDLALVNWGRAAGDRITGGATAVEDPEVLAQALRALDLDAGDADLPVGDADPPAGGTPDGSTTDGEAP